MRAVAGRPSRRSCSIPGARLGYQRAHGSVDRPAGIRMRKHERGFDSRQSHLAKAWLSVQHLERKWSMYDHLVGAVVEAVEIEVIAGVRFPTALRLRLPNGSAVTLYATKDGVLDAD